MGVLCIQRRGGDAVWREAGLGEAPVDVHGEFDVHVVVVLLAQQELNVRAAPALPPWQIPGHECEAVAHAVLVALPRAILWAVHVLIRLVELKRTLRRKAVRFREVVVLLHPRMGPRRSALTEEILHVAPGAAANGGPPAAIAAPRRRDGPPVGATET